MCIHLKDELYVIGAVRRSVILQGKVYTYPRLVCLSIDYIDYLWFIPLQTFVMHCTKKNL